MDRLNLGCGIRFRKDWINIDFTSTDPAVRAHNLRKGIPLPDGSMDVVYHSHLLEHFSRREAKKFLDECGRVLRPGGVIRVAVPDLEGIVKAYLESLNEVKAGTAGAEERHEWMTIELLDQMVREKSGGEMLAYMLADGAPARDFILGRLGTQARRVFENIRVLRARPGAMSSPSILARLSCVLSGLDADALEAARFRHGGEVHKWMYDSYSLKRTLEKAGFAEVVQRSASESYIPEWSRQDLDTEPDGSIYKPDSLFMEGMKISL